MNYTLLLTQIILLSFLISGQSASAQGTDTRSTIKNGASTIPKDKIRNTYAVIAGVSKYQHLTPLAYADADARMLRNFLMSDGGGNIPKENILEFLNENATSSALSDQSFAWLAKQIGLFFTYQDMVTISLTIFFSHLIIQIQVPGLGLAEQKDTYLLLT